MWITVWNSRMVDEAFCEFTDGGFSGIITCRKGKSTVRMSIYSSKYQVLSFP